TVYLTVLLLILQITPFFSSLCHALLLALQITPITAVHCHASYFCVTNRTNLVSILSCTAACVTNHTNLESALSCILALRYKSDQSCQHFVMHCSLRYKSHQIPRALCHALQLALQITPNPESTLSFTAACVTNQTNLDSALSCTLALHYDELLFTMTIGDVLQEFQHNRSNSQCPLSI